MSVINIIVYDSIDSVVLTTNNTKRATYICQF